MIQFYAPDIESVPVLPESESLHCVKVLRTPAGTPVEVIDGKGNTFTCRLLEAHPKHAMVEILEKRSKPLPWAYALTVGVAPTKHMDRMEWLTEKLTEVGVNKLVPLLCDRSERRELKIERLEKTAISAMKQSLKAVLPEVCPLTPVRQIIEQCTAEQRFICYCDDNVGKRRVFSKEVRPGADITILIGPEGDFSPAEVDLALTHGFIPVTLGDNRLRTETAALFAASATHVINQLQSR